MAVIFRNINNNPHTPIDTETGEVLVREGAKVKKPEYDNLPSANRLVENYEKNFGTIWFQNLYSHPENHMKVVRETDKAVAIENAVYNEAKQVAARDVKELSFQHQNALRNGSSLIWLPKSQVKVENGNVVDMPDWLAEKNGLSTASMRENLKKRFQEGANRYESALDFAKKNGVAVRNHMKLSTIMEKIREAGLKYEN